MTNKLKKKDLVVEHRDHQCEFIRNEQHVKIMKACISCAYKSIDNLGARTCLKFGIPVDKYHICNKWRMSDSHIVAGIPNGSVNVHCYEEYLDKRKKMTEEQAWLNGLTKNAKYQQKTGSNK